MASGDLVSVDDVKEAISLPGTAVELDILIPTFITQSSAAIKNYCKREFSPVSVGTTRRFTVSGYKIDLSPYDLQSATAVTLHPEGTAPVTLTNGVGGTSIQYMLMPPSKIRGVYTSIELSNFLVIISQTLFQFGFALMDVTGTWGFPTVPDDVKRACIITVGSWITRTAPGSSGAYGVPGMSGGAATLFRNDWHIPWAAKNLLGPYRRGSARWAIN